jgi:hypothetical protein
VPPASQEPVPADLAGAWTRVGARLLDYLFVHPGLLAVSAVLDLSLGFPDDGGYALTVLAVLVVYETAFLYNRGQTLAKPLLGLRVIRADRAPLTLGDALKRSGIVGALGLVPFGLLDGDGAGPAAPGPARQGGPDAGRQHQATPKALLLGMNRCPAAPLRLAAVGGPPLPTEGDRSVRRGRGVGPADRAPPRMGACAVPGRINRAGQRPGQDHVKRLERYAEWMTVREMLTALQTLPRDAELLAVESGCEDFCEREVDEVEWQGGRVYLHLGARRGPEMPLEGAGQVG